LTLTLLSGQDTDTIYIATRPRRRGWRPPREEGGPPSEALPSWACMLCSSPSRFTPTTRGYCSNGRPDENETGPSNTRLLLHKQQEEEASHPDQQDLRGLRCFLVLRLLLLPLHVLPTLGPVGFALPPLPQLLLQR